MPEAIIEQYKELCSNARNIDSLLWTFPTAAFSLEGATLYGFFTYTSIKTWVLLIGTLGFTAFFVQLSRFRAYQINTEQAINEIMKKNLDTFSPVNQWTKLQPLPEDTFWLLRLGATVSSSSFMLFVGLVVLIFNLCLLFFS